jgi:hypothetical protein
MLRQQVKTQRPICNLWPGSIERILLFGEPVSILAISEVMKKLESRVAVIGNILLLDDVPQY